ncbi:MAG: extracellular solute-binding protein [Patescibacteria group bacterium]
MSKKLLFILAPLAVIAIFVIIFSMLSGGKTKVPASAITPKTLTYWRVQDSQASFDPIITSWRAMHPNVTIQYRTLRYEEYEQALLEAWAKGEGPDIYSIPNTWVHKYQDFITPMPASTGLAYYSTVKSLGIKEEQKIEYKETPSIQLPQLANNFVDSVYEDVVIEDKIYGLPYSVDNIGLFYNKELLNQAKIPLPPTTYSELLADVKKLTKIDSEGNIIQAGVALGGTENIPRSMDILFLLMLQSRSTLTDPPNFLLSIPDDPQTIPAVNALDFYAQFSDPNKEVYTWNKDLPNALEMFAQGKLAFFFGYSYNIPLIDQLSAGQLSYGTANVPQLNQDLNYANYWVETVAQSSKYANEAWDFLQYATRVENVTGYLESSGRPTALKALVDVQREDFLLRPFIEQSLVAKNWYHGKKPNIMEQYITDAIDSVVNNQLEAKEALQLAQKLILQTYTD